MMRPTQRCELYRRGLARLEIVWRNPLPLARSEHKVQRIKSDKSGAVYAVTNPDFTKEFELILCAA